MNRRIFIVAALSLTAAFTSCKKDNDKTVAVTGVTLNHTSYTLDIGGELKLEAAVVPQNATNTEVEWESDKPNIASVDDNGNVVAKADGLAKITVTTKDGNHQAICEITVVPDPVPFIHFWADKANAVYPNDLTVGYDVGSFATFLKRGYAAFGNIHTVELAVEAEAALVTDDREVFFKMGSAALTPSGEIKKGQGTAKFSYDVEIVVAPGVEKDVVFTVDFDKTKGFIQGAENRKSYTLACTNSNGVPNTLAGFFPTYNTQMFLYWPTACYGATYEIPKLKFIALIFGYPNFEGTGYMDTKTWVWVWNTPNLPINAYTGEKPAMIALNAELRKALVEYKALNVTNPVKYPKLCKDGSEDWIEFPVYE